MGANVSENAAKVAMKFKFPGAVCRKGICINFLLCKFCKCWKHKRCSGFKCKLKEVSEPKCQLCVNQQTDMLEDYPDWHVIN